MAEVKITIIGGGSGGFTLEHVKAICLTPNLHGSTVCLMDINADRLNDVLVVCRRLVQQAGVDLKLEQSLDRRAALQGADFVINTALLDGGRRLSDGWRIAEQHGILWGGSYHILYDEPFWLNYYQLRLFEGIARDMLELCPRAWLLLVANPVLAGTTLLQRKYPELQMVGLCGADRAVHTITNALGLDHARVTYEVPGVNHFIWLTKMFHKGQDVFPLIGRWLETEAEKYWADHPEGELGLKKLDLYRNLGAIPIGDSASITGASWPWWYHSSAEVEKHWRTNSRDWWYNYAENVRQAPEHFKQLVRDERHSFIKDEEKRQEGGHGLQIPIIESIACDIPRVFIVNILNANEFVAGIPRDFEVEIPAQVGRRGVQGIKTGGLPKPIIAHILRDRVAPVEMELAAYEKGSRALLAQLVLMDKWTQSLQHAQSLIDAIFALPYHRELREHYQ